VTTTMQTLDGGETAACIRELLAAFKLPTLADEMVSRFVEAGQASVLPLLLEVLELEAGDRRERRVDRLRRASRLPPGKTFATLDEARLPRPLAQQLHVLARGEFLEHATNVLAFGLPGVGKSHAACAVGHALVEAGHSVYFAPTYQLVQELLQAKRDLDLPRALRKLDLFDLLILDDIGYVQQSPDEIEVLFTLLAERYERRSVLITSNLVFSQWDQIFKNPMTTAAAIDRLVHHSVILEFAVPSYRSASAKTPAPSQAETGRSNAPTVTATETVASPSNAMTDNTSANNGVNGRAARQMKKPSPRARRPPAKSSTSATPKAPPGNGAASKTRRK
jgi:DNA replication protein DnaC